MKLRRRAWEYGLPVGTALFYGLAMFFVPWNRTPHVILVIYVMWSIAGILCVSMASKRVSDSVR